MTYQVKKHIVPIKRRTFTDEQKEIAREIADLIAKLFHAGADLNMAYKLICSIYLGEKHNDTSA